MHDGVREITGFVCRWCVLSLAGAAVLVGSWTGLRGAGPVTASLRADVICPDMLCRQSHRKAARLTLHHVDSPAGPGASQVLVRLPDGTQLVDRMSRDSLSVVAVSRARPGQIEIQMIGLPYGPVAFRRGRSMAVIIPAGRRGLLVDGRSVLSAIGAETVAWRRCLALMARRGRVAFLFVGSAGDYPAARAKLQRVLPGTAVEFGGPDHQTAYRRLRQVLWALNPDGDKAQPRPSFVTDQLDLAVRAGRGGFATHLVGRLDRPIAGARGQVHHESLSELAEWLSAWTGGGR